LNTKRFQTAWAVATVLVFGLAGAVAAETPQADAGSSDEAGVQTERATAPAALMPVDVAGMKVYVDPETGKMRPPTKEEAELLAAALRTQFMRKGFHAKRSAGPVFHKSGVISAVVGTDFLDFSFAHIARDGSVHVECVPGPEGALAMVEATEEQVETDHDGRPVE